MHTWKNTAVMDWQWEHSLRKLIKNLKLLLSALATKQRVLKENTYCDRTKYLAST